MRITRRQILAAAAAVPVVGALAAGGVAWRWWDRPPGAGLKRLSTEEHAFVQAFAETAFPPGGEPPLSGADAELGWFVDDLVDGMEPGMRVDFKLLLHALDDWTVPRRLAPFRSLSPEVRQQVLRNWLDHDVWLVRNALFGFLVLVSEGWSMHPEVRPLLAPYFRCGYGP